MKLTSLIFAITLSGLLFTGCEKQDFEGPLANEDNSDVLFKKSPAIWADCEAFATLGTNTSFSPTAGNFDELYNGANFLDGLGAVSESKPGDPDYNGGRWHVNTLKAGVDPDKYNNVCSVDDIDLDDFESTSTYFECPLRPIRGNSGE